MKDEIILVALKAIRTILGETYWDINKGCGDNLSEYCDDCKHEKVCRAFNDLDIAIRGLK